MGRIIPYIVEKMFETTNQKIVIPFNMLFISPSGLRFSPTVGSHQIAIESLGRKSEFSTSGSELPPENSRH
jgi:hypothetical protein